MVVLAAAIDVAAATRADTEDTSLAPHIALRMSDTEDKKLCLLVAAAAAVDIQHNRALGNRNRYS